MVVPFASSLRKSATKSVFPSRSSASLEPKSSENTLRGVRKPRVNQSRDYAPEFPKSTLLTRGHAPAISLHENVLELLRSQPGSVKNTWRTRQSGSAVSERREGRCAVSERFPRQQQKAQAIEPTIDSQDLGRMFVFDAPLKFCSSRCELNVPPGESYLHLERLLRETPQCNEVEEPQQSYSLFNEPSTCATSGSDAS